MVLRHVAKMGAALLVAGALAIGAAPPASAHTSSSGNRSLAGVLAKDGSGFDRNWNDFDIVDNAVSAVLEAKPNSPVKVLADGKTRVTAFLPTDRAFRLLVKDLTGTWAGSEKQVFTTVASLGIDTVETVLLYHVVPGATITAKKALASDGVELTTAQGGKVTVDVLAPTSGKIRLQDLDPTDVDPFTIPALRNVNKGNKQIAHGISYVLRPADL